jgi:hypothetical protein
MSAAHSWRGIYQPARSANTTHPMTAPRIFQPRTFSKRTRQRFTRSRREALAAHLGREPSYAERILIGRIVALEWELAKQDAALDEDAELSGHAMRARNASENRLRLDLVALGLRAAPAPRQGLMERLMAHRENDGQTRIAEPPGPVMATAEQGVAP